MTIRNTPSQLWSADAAGSLATYRARDARRAEVIRTDPKVRELEAKRKALQDNLDANGWRTSNKQALKDEIARVVSDKERAITAALNAQPPSAADPYRSAYQESLAGHLGFGSIGGE